MLRAFERNNAGVGDGSVTYTVQHGLSVAVAQCAMQHSDADDIVRIARAGGIDAANSRGRHAHAAAVSLSSVIVPVPSACWLGSLPHGVL